VRARAYDATQDGAWLIARLPAQIKRDNREYERAPRLYTSLTGARDGDALAVVIRRTPYAICGLPPDYEASA
jgi:hypothetical protein